MNKQRGIIIGILALAVTMMVGYALFSETITINGTATAKGEFDVGIECQKGLDTPFISEDDLKWLYETSYTATEGGYKNDSCSVTGNTMSFSSELEYPGATRYFIAKITNNGTIDATLDISDGIEKYLTEKVYIDKNENGAFEENEIFDSSELSGTVNANYSTTRIDMYALEKADGTKLKMIGPSDDSGQANEFISTDGTSLILKPGNSVYFLIRTNLDKHLGSNNGGSIYTKTESSYTFTFSQPRAN